MLMNAVEEFYEHWAKIPKQGLVPRLSDFLDYANPALQPWVMILDVGVSQMMTRFYGTMMVNLTGSDLTGTDHLAIFPEKQRSAVLARHSLVVTHPCGTRATAHVSTSRGRKLELLGIGLPLIRSNGEGCVARFTQVIQTLGYGDVAVRSSLTQQIPTFFDIGAGKPNSP
jgi:hypothetical protein